MFDIPNILALDSHYYVSCAALMNAKCPVSMSEKFFDLSERNESVPEKWNFIVVNPSCPESLLVESLGFCLESGFIKPLALRNASISDKVVDGFFERESGWSVSYLWFLNPRVPYEVRYEALKDRSNLLRFESTFAGYHDDLLWREKRRVQMFEDIKRGKYEYSPYVVAEDCRRVRDSYSLIVDYYLGKDLGDGDVVELEAFLADVDAFYSLMDCRKKNLKVLRKRLKHLD